MNTMEKVKSLQANLKKNQCVVITYDEGHCNDRDDFVTLIFKKVQDGDFHCVRRNGSLYTIDGCDDNHIKTIFVAKADIWSKLDAVKESKSPESAARHVGVELEFISKLSQDEIGALLANAGVEEFVTIKDDGSVETERDAGFRYSHEIAIIASERKIAKVIEKVCVVLAGNSKVNKSCGLHVHLDMRTRNPDVAYKALFEAQPILYAMCPKSRISGTYSKPTMSYRSFVQDAFELGENDDRYHGINKASYLRHQTLEIRLHSGTLAAGKIINWVKLLIKIVDARGNLNTLNTENASMVRDTKAFQDRVKLDSNLFAYVQSRIENFKEDHVRSDMKLVS